MYVQYWVPGSRIALAGPRFNAGPFPVINGNCENVVSVWFIGRETISDSPCTTIASTTPTEIQHKITVGLKVVEITRTDRIPSDHVHVLVRGFTWCGSHATTPPASTQPIPEPLLVRCERRPTKSTRKSCLESLTRIHATRPGWFLVQPFRTHIGRVRDEHRGHGFFG